ncbi:isochorismatase family protein [Pseudooceanicola sp. MF1-13]|uniref:isochorismatase family protein n=1 Tax=Pseudooceanicola sp. MF1-13 TaxID=3379095 RepID=UPI0038921B00
MHSPLTLPLTRTTVLPIDMQEEHRRDPRYLVDGYDHVLANAAQVIGAARHGGVRVLHAGFRRDFDKVPPRPFEPTESEGTPAFSDPDTPDIAFCPEVAPAPGETILWKNDLSCFAEDGFDDLLGRPEWVVIFGVWAEACVAATVRDAVARGIRVLLVKDAIGSGTVEMAQTGLINLANRLYGGAVCDAETACALLAGEPREVWQLVGSAPLRYRANDIGAVFDGL